MKKHNMQSALREQLGKDQVNFLRLLLDEHSFKVYQDIPIGAEITCDWLESLHVALKQADYDPSGVTLSVINLLLEHGADPNAILFVSRSTAIASTLLFIEDLH